MNQKIAVAIIHGVGDQKPDFAETAISKLSQTFAHYLPEGNKSVADKLVFAPIFWAGIVAKKQRILWNTVEDDDGNLNLKLIRKFFLHFGGDAIAYQPSSSRHQTYDQIHQTVTEALSQLANLAGDKAPLCIVGHSIGTIIIHNYFFDMARVVVTDTIQPQVNTALERGETFALFYTLGSPLAVWSLRYDNYRTFSFPGQQISTLYPQIKPKWTNCYDKDDVLAYPIRSLSKDHQELAQQGILEDVQVNSGNILKSWNPLSHTAYLVDDSVIKPIAQDLFDTWQAINQERI